DGCVRRAGSSEFLAQMRPVEPGCRRLATQAWLVARVYPASSTAALTAAGSTGAALWIVTREVPPAFRSTSTDSTPSTAASSSLTLDTQCEHVIPATKTSSEEDEAAVGVDASVFDGTAQHA